MKLSELIQHVGDANVFVQILQPNFKGARLNINNSGQSSVTFMTSNECATDLAVPTDKPKFVGMVIWLPNNKMPEHLQRKA